MEFNPQVIMKLIETFGPTLITSTIQIYLYRRGVKDKLQERAENSKDNVETYRLLTDAQTERIEKIGEAERRNLEKMAETKIKLYQDFKAVIKPTKTDFISFDSDYEKSINARIGERLLTEEVQKQENLESVFTQALDSLLNVHEVSPEPISKDWVMKYLDSVKFVSDKESQKIWADTLVREITVTNSISIRSLNILKDCSRSDIELLSRISNFVVTFKDLDLIQYVRDGNIYPNNVVKHNLITEKEFAHLKNIGVITSLPFAPIERMSYWDVSNENIYKYFNKGIVVKGAEKSGIPCLILLTESGGELLHVIKSTFNIDYFEWLISSLPKEYLASVGDIKENIDGTFSVENILTIR